MSQSAVDDGEDASPLRARIGETVRAKLKRNPMTSPIASDTLEIFGRPAFLSAQECTALRAMIDAGAKPSALFSGPENPTYRTSSSCHLAASDPLIEVISNRITGLMGIDPATGETLQGQRYMAGQEYQPHYDYFATDAAYWPRMRGSGGQRCWTAMIYLNAVAEGGETQFPHCGFMVPPVEGMILIWNNMRPDGSPNPSSLHAARPVVSGTKYVVTKWFRERPWTPRRNG